MNKRKYIASLLIAFSLSSLIGCDNTPSVEYEEPIVIEKEEKEQFDFNAIVSDADEIKIKERIFNLNKVYEIFVDGQTIGRIDGKFVNVTGDVFTLTDREDNTIASEKQIKRWSIKLNRLAEVYDANNNVTGYIGEEVIKDFFKLGRMMHFYDANRNEIGTCEQKVFNVFDEYVIYDNDGNEDYRIKEKVSLMAPEYNIEIKDKDSVIKPTDAIFVTSILDAIKSSSEEE